jgi:plastocyanin
MIVSRWPLSVVVVAALFIGCDKKTSTSSGGSAPAQATNTANGNGTTPAASVGGVGNGSISGKVTFEGPAPKPKVINMAAVPQCAQLHANPVLDDTVVIGANGEIKDVVVYVTDGAKLGGSLPTTPVLLDQKGCVYTPHVVALMAGQDLSVRNSDGFLHNVHGLRKENPEFNFPQSQAGQTNKVENAAPETYKVKCDVHPWMNAWVFVLDHPFSAVTGDDGTFTIKGLKDGKYLLTAHHQKLGTQEAVVEMKDGKAVSDFKFSLKK